MSIALARYARNMMRLHLKEQARSRKGIDVLNKRKGEHIQGKRMEEMIRLYVLVYREDVQQRWDRRQLQRAVKQSECIQSDKTKRKM